MRRTVILAPVAALVLAVLATATVAARSPVALGISSERSRDVAAVNDYKASTGSKPSLWTIWSDWGDRGGRANCVKGVGTCGFPTELANKLRQRGVTPFIWWQPNDPANLGSSLYAGYQNIIKGKHDTYIRDWAKAAKAFGRPVVVRFAHEMNGNWFPWSIGNHGNTPGGFVKAWRHVVNEVRAVGARNVKFLWSPYNAESGGYAPFYPGNAYVDYVGVTSLNWGNERWRWLPDLLSRPMQRPPQRQSDQREPVGQAGHPPRGGLEPPRRSQGRLDPERIHAGVQDDGRPSVPWCISTTTRRPSRRGSPTGAWSCPRMVRRCAPTDPWRAGPPSRPRSPRAGPRPGGRPRRPAVPRARRRRMGHPFHTSVMLAWMHPR